MAINEQTKITVPFANSGLRNDIPQTATGSNLASYEEGFPAITMTAIDSGGQPPTGQDFNGILNVITKALQYEQSGGLYKYDSDFAESVGGYPLGAVLRSASGAKIWVNTSAENATDPDNGGQNWVELTNATAVSSAISSAVSAETTARTDAISAEATARENADTALEGLIDEKQDTLIFDTTPTANSSNPVTSGGIKTAIDNIDALPSQTGQSGKFLSTNGTQASWKTVDALPSQTGNNGKFLTTNGTTASWQPVPSRNIGEIIQSAIPLTDAGLHLLDGSLLPSGGVYAQFVQHINGLQATYPDLFATQAEFDASVSAYGSCGKFVVSASGVRLPKVSDILQGTTDLSAVGDLVEAGLPNITASWASEITQSGAFIKTTSHSGAAAPYITTNSANINYASISSSNAGVSINASRSSPYYKDSVTKPTPQTIKSLLYICVATSVKTPVEANIDNVITDVNNKLDRDLSNVVGDAVERVVEQGESYIRYSSGKQICWGMTNTNSSTTTITFAKAFSSMAVVTASNSNFNGTINVAYTGATTFQVYIAGASTNNVNILYHAIGRWK